MATKTNRESVLDAISLKEELMSAVRAPAADSKRIMLSVLSAVFKEVNSLPESEKVLFKNQILPGMAGKLIE
jgi:hypothetical protein